MSVSQPEAQSGGPEALLRRFERARRRRVVWEDHWRDCYEFAMPQRDGALSGGPPGERKTDRLFDGTAPEAVDQLAASLMAELTPPWSRWFGFVPGTAVPEQDAQRLAAPLEEVAATVQSHFDRSNFAVEIHQCYLDLVTAGTACLLFEEAPLGEPAAFRFTAVPLGEAVLEEGASGLLDVTFRRHEYSGEALAARFPHAAAALARDPVLSEAGEARLAVVEAVVPDNGGFAYRAVVEPSAGQAAQIPESLSEGRFDVSPFINFRWTKAPGETYGRSPVMKALPDIKTANKVVELVLKNATIAVTGIWQADDDGVLNPATVKLLPGTIIPKAVGSSGLTPLTAPGSFDVSGLVLDDLRARIRASLLADRLGQIDAPRMTATEILERSAEMERQLGATYGRLQAELLFPLARRAVAILRRRGEIPDIAVDGHDVDLQIVSPIAMHRRHAEAQAALQWFQTLGVLGPDAAQIVKPQQAARWLAKAFRVPETLLRTEEELDRMRAEQTAPGAQGAADPMAMLSAMTGPAMAAQMEAAPTGPAAPGGDHAG
ncbi:MAG: portal protein [Alphaproteobacteria bacterium]|nr:portal protein [Alphaproteobacteria bacterium]